MRVTTNMMIRNYQTNLNRSLTSLDTTRTRVMSKRNFSRASEDPAAAAKSFRLRNDYAKNEDFLETLKSIQGELASVEASEMQIKTACDDAYDLIQQAAGGALNEEQRKIAATSLRELQKSVLLSINAKFGNKFLFGGTDTKNVPFELSDDGKTLTYRGVDVNDPANTDVLKELSGEKLYADLGFGLAEQLGKVPGSTIQMKYGTNTFALTLKDAVVEAPPSSVTHTLKYDTLQDTVDSINTILQHDSSLGDLQGKIKVSNDGGKLKIDYTDKADADNKELKILTFSNTVVNQALGLSQGDSMSPPSGIQGDTSLVGTPDGNLDGKKLTIKYGNASYDFTFPTPSNCNTMTDVVNELNNQLTGGALDGKLTFSDAGGTLRIAYDNAATHDDIKDFSVSGSGATLEILGLPRGASVQNGISGTTPSVPITEQRHEIVDSTAYDAANIGLNVLGYGSENGISKNIILLMGQMADKLTEPNFDQESMDPYQEMMNTLRNRTLDSVTQLGTKSKFLEDTQARLEENEFNLNKQIVDIENVDMAGAITEYMWAQYAYNAALKVGNSLLSSSFIDFMG